MAERAAKSIMDVIDEAYDKRSGTSVYIEGRDLMGVLTDSFCEEFFSAENIKLKALAERLMKNVPFIRLKDIQYQQDIHGNLKKKKGGKADIMGLDIAHQFSHIEPGMSIAEVLKIYSASRGLMFWCMPDGSFVFGRPVVGGPAAFDIINRISDPSNNNALRGQRTRDISKRYSKVKVVGQQQGYDLHGSGSDGAKKINTKAEIIDPTFPFYKPFVATDNNDSRSPKLHARMLLEKMIAQGRKLTYTVQGHSYKGKNWRINEMCKVEDEGFRPPVSDNLMITGRTFEFSKQAGSQTHIRLGLPGLVE